MVVSDILDRKCIPEEKWPREAAGLLKQWRYVATADPQKSEFFETNNVKSVMEKHGVRFAQYRTLVYSNRSLKDSFKDCMIQGRKTVFLSYRWKEARRFAIALARAFRNKGLSPWLDALSIPGYKGKAKASGDRIVNEPRLEKWSILRANK